MRILDKYILKRVISSYIVVLFCFIGLHLIIDLFSNLSDFLREKTSIYVILNYYFYLFPLIFLRTSTFSIPISVLFSLGELNKNNEITSMRSSGISIIRLSLPIIIFALLLSFISLFLQERVLIYSQKKVEDIKLEYIKRGYKGEKAERNFVFRHKNQLFFVSKFLPQENSLNDVVIFKEDKQGDIKEKIVCQTVIYDGTKWKAFNVIGYQVDKQGEIVDHPFYWENLELDLDEKPKTITLKKSSFSQFLSLNVLKKEIERLKLTASSGLLYNLIIDYNKKIAEPFSHLFLVIGVLPFALEIRKRKVGLSALGGGFIFGFIYYVIFSVSIAFGKAGIIIPALSSWVAPLFFLVMGISGLVLIR